MRKCTIQNNLSLNPLTINNKGERIEFFFTLIYSHFFFQTSTPVLFPSVLFFSIFFFHFCFCFAKIVAIAIAIVVIVVVVVWLCHSYNAIWFWSCVFDYSINRLVVFIVWVGVMQVSFEFWINVGWFAILSLSTNWHFRWWHLFW